MAGTSALLKTAANIREQLATYQDAVKAFEFSNSAYTDAALSDYKAYLQTRINALSSTGSISDASKALSLTKSLDGATKSNISATIQRENIQMLSGNATLTDKYNVIVGQYSRAVANGDLTLAQSLMSQAYSVDQSIQLQRQQAADAQVTLAKAAEAAGKSAAASEGNIADSLTGSLKQLNNDIKTIGMGGANKAVKAWVNANSDTLQTLGVKLPNQPSYWDIVQGVAGAQYNHYMLASTMYAPYGTGPGSDSWKMAGKAYNVNAGIDKLPTLAGGLSLQEVMQAAANPSEYIYNPSQGKFVQTQQTGNSFQTSGPDGKGPLTLQPTYSGTVEKTVVISPAETAIMTKLGLNFAKNKNGSASDGVQIQATDKSPVWVQQVLGKNGVTNMFTSENGLQFTSDSKSGSGKSVYTVVADAKGHLGIAEQADNGDHILNGEYGFDGTTSFRDPVQPAHHGLLDRIGGVAKSAFSDMAGLFTGHNSAQGILGNGTTFGPPPIPIQQQVALPTISLAAPPPLPSISTAPTSQIAAVIPKTVSIQAPSTTIQGSTVNPQSGGTGIAIKGTTNAPVGMRF